MEITLAVKINNKNKRIITEMFKALKLTDEITVGKITLFSTVVPIKFLDTEALNVRDKYVTIPKDNAKGYANYKLHELIKNLNNRKNKLDKKAALKQIKKLLIKTNDFKQFIIQSNKEITFTANQQKIKAKISDFEIDASEETHYISLEKIFQNNIKLLRNKLAQIEKALKSLATDR